MDFKLNYISRLLQRVSSKRIEHYVISRIWHLLGNYDIKMIPQQYVSRESYRYALTDVFFPQIDLHVEVNEPAHYDNNNRITNDLNRKNEIESRTGHQVITIDCRQNLNELHIQIDKLIELIKQKVNDQIVKKTFKPWNPDNEHNPIYWKNKDLIHVSDEIALHTVEDICLLFNADYLKTKRGFLRKGGIVNPINENIMIWWPSEFSRSGWVNTYNDIEETITETHSDFHKNLKHYELCCNGDKTRIVFFHYKDVLGIKNYKYIGIFKNDRINSNIKCGTIWKRIGHSVNLKSGEFK